MVEDPFALPKFPPMRQALETRPTASFVGMVQREHGSGVSDSGLDYD